MFSFVFMFLIGTGLYADVGEVKKTCGERQVPIIKLKYRDRDSNISLIQKTLKDVGEYQKLLKRLYEITPFPEKSAFFEELVESANKDFIPKSSRFKKAALKYQSRESRLKSPTEFINEVLTSYRDSGLIWRNQLDWYLTQKEKSLLSSVVRAARKDEDFGLNGAVFRINFFPNGKYSTEIVLSNNESEPFPRLLVLLAHELSHARSYKQKLAAMESQDAAALAEFGLLDEASGNDLEMETYIALAKRDPELFCNWLYRSWRYGDILVPLSWTMHSLEMEMRDGSLLKEYILSGAISGKDILIESSSGKIRQKYLKKLAQINLKFVRGE